jgi:ethanolamine-phosphate phospho-lyase
VIALDGAYHGHLTTTIDISAYKFKKINDGKKKNWVHVAPLPCSYRGKYTRDDYSISEISKLYAQDVQEIINSATNQGRRIGAFIHESMVSCGGQVVLPPNYLKTVYESVREAGGVCIADEVQVGFGRIGSHFWAFETQGPDAIPDIVTLGKPIGNGHPLACVVTTPEIADSFEAIGTEYFNTYGGNPVSLAIANAVLDVIESEGLQAHAAKLGQFLLDELEPMKLMYNFIGDIRGQGLFLGIDLVTHPITKAPATQLADYIVKRCKEQKIIISTEGKYGNVLKFKPPMCFTIENCKKLLRVLKNTFDEVENFYKTSTSSSISCDSLPSSGDEDESSEFGSSE